MKKQLGLLLFITFCAIQTISAISYDDNEYQVKSREYSELAKEAFDKGDYDSAIEYSKLAEDYAQKSYDYIQMMLARTEAEDAMNKARTRLKWAKDNNASEFHPDQLAIAEEALDAGIIAFDNENYDVAVVCAKKVLDALGVVTGDESGFRVLPSEYKVRTWRGVRDCLWNIAKNPAVYNDPYKWRILYKANKDRLPDPNNPNWLEPGIILRIPSLKCENRKGQYDHEAVYESLDSAQERVKGLPCDEKDKTGNVDNADKDNDPLTKLDLEVVTDADETTEDTTTDETVGKTE